MFWNIFFCWVISSNGCALHLRQILHFPYGRRLILLVCARLVCIYQMNKNWNKKKEFKTFLFFIGRRFPFNWRTPLRYLVAWLAQSAGLSVLASIIIHFLNLVFGSCWLFIFIVEDVTQDVVAFNIAAKAVVSNGNGTELTNRFCDTVQIYSDAKR